MTVDGGVFVTGGLSVVASGVYIHVFMYMFRYVYICIHIKKYVHEHSYFMYVYIRICVDGGVFVTGGLSVVALGVYIYVHAYI
jgi:hypothetical protein